MRGFKIPFKYNLTHSARSLSLKKKSLTHFGFVNKTENFTNCLVLGQNLLRQIADKQ